jgi:hypothetical protein
LQGRLWTREPWAQLPEELTVRLVEIQVAMPGFRSQTCVLVTTLLDAQSIYGASKLGETHHEPNMKDSSQQPNQTSTRRFRSAWFIAIVLATLAVTWPRTAEGQITNGVFASASSPYGKTYAQWSAGWWQWTYSLPTTASPIQDTAPISTGQSGPVWFLGGTFGLGGDQTRVRSGSVPEGTALFVAIMEAWADNANCPADNYTTAQLRSLAANAQDPAFAMSCTIDGQNTVDLNGAPPDYRVQSPVFNYTVPGVHNYLYDLFGATRYLNPDGTPFAITGAVADGVYLMVAPLAPGAHTIHFSGSYPFPPVTYVQDITYNLTVCNKNS